MHEVAYDIIRTVFGTACCFCLADISRRSPSGLVGQHGLEGAAVSVRPRRDDRDKRRLHPTFISTRTSAPDSRTWDTWSTSAESYIGDFRKINRLANRWAGRCSRSFWRSTTGRLDWLTSLPYVDPARIGFYGLSYGGKTALRVPPLLALCAFGLLGDFNEWVRKITTVNDSNSYMFTQEYEMPEFNLAGVANHAEMAKMMAPRPFMVERGHRDGVGFDEWVAFEYAKVKNGSTTRWHRRRAPVWSTSTTAHDPRSRNRRVHSQSSEAMKKSATILGCRHPAHRPAAFPRRGVVAFIEGFSTLAVK